MEHPLTSVPAALPGVVADGRTTYAIQSKSSGLTYIDASLAAPAALAGSELRRGEWVYVVADAGEEIWVSATLGGSVFYSMEG